MILRDEFCYVFAMWTVLLSDNSFLDVCKYGYIVNVLYFLMPTLFALTILSMYLHYYHHKAENK